MRLPISLRTSVFGNVTRYGPHMSDSLAPAATISIMTTIINFPTYWKVHVITTAVFVIVPALTPMALPRKPVPWERGFRYAQRRDHDRVDRSHCRPVDAR